MRVSFSIRRSGRKTRTENPDVEPENPDVEPENGGYLLSV
jgi:hypothetical protein